MIRSLISLTFEIWKKMAHLIWPVPKYHLAPLGASQCIRRLMSLSVTYYNCVLNEVQLFRVALYGPIFIYVAKVKHCTGLTFSTTNKSIFIASKWFLASPFGRSIVEILPEQCWRK